MLFNNEKETIINDIKFMINKLNESKDYIEKNNKFPSYTDNLVIRKSCDKIKLHFS